MKNNKKTINKKRIIARVVALCATLGVIIALALPCFANDYFDGTITDDYYTAFVNTDIPDIYHDSDHILMYIINSYRDGSVRNAGSDGLFGCELLCYGKMNYNSETSRPGGYPTFEYYLGEDTDINYQVYLEYIALDVLRDNMPNPFSLVLDEATFDFSLRCTGDDVVVEITLSGVWYDRDDVPYEEMVVFRNTQGTYSPNQTVEFVGPYTYSYYEAGQLIGEGVVTSIETAYTVKNTFLLGTSITSVGLIQTFLFSENSYTYYNPLAFANGYYAGKHTAPTYEQGYTDGYTTGYNNGRNEGYILGHNDGYDAGYEAGEQASYDTGYTEGFNQGINTNESANLGKNLIGDTLSAPLEALNQFTIVSWITQDGTAINITLGSLISACIGVLLVIWFLKMFAGG